MGWNPFKDVSNFVSHVGHEVGNAFNWVGHHPLETLAIGVGGYYGGEALGLFGGGGGGAADVLGPGVGVETGGAGYIGAEAGAGALGPGVSAGSGLDGLAGIPGPGNILDAGGGGGPLGPGVGPTTSGMSTYDQMLEYLKKGGKGVGDWFGSHSGKQLGRLGAGALGLYRANQVRQMSKMPDPKDIQGMPGYKAGLDAVQASSAQQGYTGGSNAAAAIGKYGADFYGNYVNQRMQAAGGLSGAGVSELGSLGLLMSGW